MDRRAEIEGRLEAATRAPWGAGPNRVFAANADGTPATGGMRVGMYPYVATVSREDDAAFIAAAPTDLRWLLAELARVEGERDAAVEAHRRLAWSVVANAGRRSRKRQVRWGHVMDATGNGSTVATKLCIDAGFDPHENVGGSDDGIEEDEGG